MFHPIGNKIIHLDEVDSTNNYAAKLVFDGKSVPGTVILADHQTAGRGQRSAVWTSNAGENMLLSIIFEHDNLAVADQFKLSQFVAVSLVQFLRKIGIKAAIKWPNDILVEKRKIAGVLIENQLSGSFVKSSIVGIGLNVNQLKFTDLQATSIRNEKGEFTSIQEVLYQLIASFNESAQSTQRGSQLEDLYLSNLFGFEVEQRFLDEEGEFTGIIKGVEMDGRLVVLKNGTQKKYDLKEISLLLV